MNYCINNFKESTYLMPRTYNMEIANNEKFLSILNGNSLLASISLKIDGNKLILVGKNNKSVAAVDVPMDGYLSEVSYDEKSKNLIFQLADKKGNITASNVSLANLVDTYNAGEGIDINKNNQISVNISSLDKTFATDADVAQKVDKVDGKSLIDDSEIARLKSIYNYDDTNVINNINFLAAENVSIYDKLNALEDMVSNLKKSNIQVVSINESELPPILNDEGQDYIVSGIISSKSDMKGKSIALKDATLKNNARISLNASDVEIKNFIASGKFTKNNGNTVLSVNNSEYVLIKDIIFTDDVIDNDNIKTYNAIEIGLGSGKLPKNIIFENCQFLGTCSNNAILIFGTDNNAVISLNNCYFKKVSNVLRLSNKNNATNVTVNVNNCICDEWETSKPDCAGFYVCQDYTSGQKASSDAEKKALEERNNLFGDGKITINFNNCKFPEYAYPITAEKLGYVYRNASGLIKYDASIYPIINIK